MKLADQGFEPIPFVFILNFSRNSPTAASGHEHQASAGKRDEGGQHGPFVGGGIFCDLNDDVLAGFDDIFYGAIAGPGVLKIVAVDVVDLQKTVPLGAVFDKCGLEPRLHPGDLCFIYIALCDFPCSAVDIKFFQFTVFYFGESAFFGINGIDKYLAAHTGCFSDSSVKS